MSPGGNQQSWATRARAQGSQGQPAVSHDSGPCPRHYSFNQMSRATPARVRGATGLTSCPWRLELVSDGPRGRLTSSAPWARVREPEVLSRSPGRLGPVPKALQGQPDVPGDSSPAPRARGLDQVSWDTCAWVRGPAGSTSGLGGLGAVPEGPRCQPPLPGDTDSSPRAHGVDQLSRATWFCARGPAMSTTAPGRLGFVS